MVKDTKLAAYAARRDFQKTAEPKGDDAVRASDALRFVVQRHDATRLHYDLRLELDGVFKSWAVTKGPSLNPADKRLAVEVEDHPLGYGDFEGTIPKGEYGGGTVQLFDRGTWTPENGDPVKALAAGELKFSLAGKHLKGSFVLVRLKHDRIRGKRTNWLLIKHRDAAANDKDEGGGVLTIDRSVSSGRAMKTIAAGKGKPPTPFMLGDDRAPAADAIWDSSKGRAEEERAKSGRAAPKSRPTALSPKQKLAATPKKKRPAPLGKRRGDDAGFRCTAALRRRRQAAGLEPMAARDQVRRLPHAASRRGTSGGVAHAPPGSIGATGSRRSSRPRAACPTRSSMAKWWRSMPRGGRTSPRCRPRSPRRRPGHWSSSFSTCCSKTASTSGRSRSLSARRRSTRCSPPGGQARRLIRYVENFAADGPELFASARDMGLEGIVSKRANAPYRSGRTESWTKAKCRAGHEIVLGGWTDTNGSFRSLLGGVFRDGELAYVGRIGTGFSQTKIERLLPKLKAHARKTSPFNKKTSPPRAKSTHWLEPELVAEIEFAGWSADGLVRQAAFKGLRDDKPASEVAAEAPVAPSATISAIPTAAVAGGGQRKVGHAKVGKGKVAVMGVTLSHPDKTFWPDAGDGTPVTKRDLALYLEAVGDWMLPHLEGRPCSIIARPRRHRRADVLPAPRDGGRLRPVRHREGARRPRTLSGDRSHRGAGRGRADGRPRAASGERRAG